MSGHSKWSTIKHKKEIADNKRGKVFTKLAKAIVIAAKEGGADLDSNFKLRLAVDKAKQLNMPKNNIERAIAKGGGGSTNEALYEVIYEGFGPDKIAILIEVVTDNKNRSVSEIKQIFDKSGGTLGQTGSVGFLFNRKAKLTLTASKDIDNQVLDLMDTDAEDVEVVGDQVEVVGEATQLAELRDKILDKGYSLLGADLVYIPLAEVELSDEKKDKVLAFIEKLEDLDDVQAVFTNLKN